MNRSWIVALRELKERLKSRSFVLMGIFGPLLVLGLIYLLFTVSENQKSHLNVLIVDPAGIMQNKIMANESLSLNYSFANNYIETEAFKSGLRYQEFDALLEVNEKILSNKKAFLFYREKPSQQVLSLLHYQFERRLEEVVIAELSDVSLEKFRELKQPMLLDARNIYDPKNEGRDQKGWVGLFFGSVIVCFVFLFGMTILRSISREKTNRVVEVLLSTIKPRQLLLGKILGTGITAIIQFLLWLGIVSLGLYLMRETLFPDVLDASKMDVTQLSEELRQLTYQQRHFALDQGNSMVELIYQRINIDLMLGFFVIFLVLAYLFYATIFASIGAISGSESDGQQFIIPLIFLLGLSIYAGYFAIENPTHGLTSWFAVIPFTSPVVCMVKLAQGYPEGSAYMIYVSISILFVSSLLLLLLASRLYKNGILQFGHRIRLIHVLKWLRRA